MQQILKTNLSIVQSENTGMYGVVDKEFNLIVPFEYEYIDNVMTVNGIIMAKKQGIKTLIEVSDENNN